MTSQREEAVGEGMARQLACWHTPATHATHAKLFQIIESVSHHPSHPHRDSSINAAAGPYHCFPAHRPGLQFHMSALSPVLSACSVSSIVEVVVGGEDTAGSRQAGGRAGGRQES